MAGLLALHARAQDVTLTPLGNDLYNTGYTGNTLAGHNQIDTHYLVTNDTTHLTAPTFEANPLATGWVANPPNSQWITYSPYTFYGQQVVYDYHLVLTNIPIGERVSIHGMIAADDNATISANGSGPYFSNYAPNVVAGHYAAFEPFSLTFVSGATNVLNFAVDNNGGGPTGLNLQLNGIYGALTSTVGIGIQFTPPPGLTPNQTNVLTNINQINVVGVNNACFGNLTTSLLGTNPAAFGAALDELTPERLDVFSSIAFNNATFMTEDLDDYLAHRRDREGNFQVNPSRIDFSGLTVNDPTMDPTLAQVKSHLLAWNPAATDGLVSDTPQPVLMAAPSTSNNFVDNLNFFVTGNVILGQDFSQPEIAHTDYTTSSFQIGTDYQIGKNLLVGTLFDYSHTDTDLDNQGSSATIDSYSPGVFAAYAQGGWYANALGTYSFNSYTEERHVDIGSFNETANGAPTGDEEVADIDGGYEFHAKHWTFGPTLGLQYVHLNVDPFSENGGCSADLAVDNEYSNSLRSRLGGRVSYEMLDHGDHVIFTPYLDASWQHEYWGGAGLITSSFSELGGSDFTVATPGVSRNSALLALGLDADISRQVTLFTSYQVQAGADDYFGQAVQVGAKFAF
jgi:uncharacterized protein YhjY with autotransporter beta-barrel domain